MEQFGKFCFVVIALIVGTLIGGYVFMKLWTWFIVSIFHVQSINLTQSIALTFFISYIKLKKKDDEELTAERVATMLVESVVYAVLVLGMGYIITLFL